MFDRLFKRPALGLAHFFLLMLLISDLSAPALAQPKPPVDLTGKNILILHSHEGNIPVFFGTDKGLSNTLLSAGIPSVNQFYESLDLRRNPGAEHRKLLVEQMRIRYGHRKFDLIVTMYPEAMEFVLKDCRDILPAVPLLALYLPESFESPETDRRIIQHFPTPDISGTLEIALKLVPRAKHVYVVSGVHEVDRRVEGQARHDLKKWEDRLEFHYLSHMSLEDTLTTVSNVPYDSIVLVLAFSRDASGKSQTNPYVAQRLRRVSAAPIFGVFESMIGYGIAGGNLVSFERIGTKAGQLTLDILGGTKNQENIPNVLDLPPVPMFDWRQLRHWNLSEAALPKGSIIINREVTFWDFKYYILGVLAFCVAETFLIVILIAQRRRKKAAQEELDQFFNVTLDILAIANTDGYFLRLNPAAERILGYTREELVAKRFLEFVHPDDVDATREVVSALASQQRVFSFENRYRCKDGTYRWLQWTSAPAGNLIYAAARDITERKRTEEILREREEAARETAREASVLAEIGRIVSSTLNIDQIYEAFAAETKKIIAFDRIVISLFDVDKNTFRNVYMAGREVQDRGTEDVYPVEGSGHAEMLRTKSTVLVQTEDFNEYKDRFPMLLSTFEAGFRSIMNVPLFSKGKIIGGLLLRSRKPNAYEDKDVRVAESIGNQIAGAIATAQSFQEQKQMENRLRESEERFRQVAETVGDFIWEVDANGLYRYTSQSVEKILGYRPDELVGKMHFYDLFAAGDREELKTAALNVFAAKQAFRDLAHPNISKEGKVVHLETSGVPVLDETGNLVAYRGAGTDVTERRRAEEELWRYQEHLEELVRERTAELVMARDEAEGANRAKSTFLANMSHELRTPLNSILGIAQLMERDAGFPFQHRDILKILSRSGAYLLELINDVLEMSKIEAGKMVPVITNFDLHSFLGDLEEMIRLRAKQKGLMLRVEHKSPLPQYIETDVRMLRQILVNLLSNAVKFTEKGRVTLRVTFKEGRETLLETKVASPGHLKFEIEDTGIGIAPEDTQRIFESFVQVNPGRAAREGTGLGLTLSRMLIEMLGGEIALRSQLGRGSIFTFDIPVKQAEGAVVRTHEADRKLIGLMPGQPFYRLLVVDDSIENRFVLRRLLEQGGFSVLEAAGGQEAVDVYKSDQPHLIWMDVRMPGMDGYVAAQTIREAENGRRNEEGKEIHTPIIALTAHVLGDEESFSPGVFDDLVYKPYREAEIFHKLEKHLGVQFVYQPSTESAAADKDREKGVTPSDLTVLPVEWLKEFFQMLRRGRSAQLIDLISRISPEHADLAGTLAELVHIYRFDHLIVATEAALKEASNG